MTTNTTKPDLAARLADHEARLRRLEAWVAGTDFTNKEGETYYPLADIVKPWGDPQEVTHLISNDDHKGLSRLIYGDDTSPLEEPDWLKEAVDDRPAAQEGPRSKKSIFEELPPFIGLPEDLAVALADFVYGYDLRLNTDKVDKVVTALGYLAPG